MNAADWKHRLWAEIDRRRDALACLCADGLRVPAENNIVIPTLTERTALLATILHKLGAGAWTR